MVQIAFRHAGKVQKVSARSGLTLMEVAIQGGVDGIEAECGGSCSCATCHVYIAEDWRERVGSANDMEDEMLNIVQERRPSSRLSCQIKLGSELDGLVVDVPDVQG